MNSHFITDNIHYLPDVLLSGGWMAKALVALLTVASIEVLTKNIFK